MGHDTVSDAVAGQTLFIHGSSVEEGNVASFRAAAAAAVAVEEPEPAQQSSRKLTSVPKWKTAEKWRNGNDDGTPKCVFFVFFTGVFVGGGRLVGAISVPHETRLQLSSRSCAS